MLKLKTEVNQLLNQLKFIQKEMNLLFASVADVQDWQPDLEQWSFRYVAAHMATVEKDCFQVRVMRIAAGEKPHFKSYYNTGWDFSQLDLMDSLNEWAITRQEIIDYLGGLPEKRWLRTGTHSAFGTITLLDVLQTMVEHDQEHFRALKQTINEYRTKTEHI